MKYFGKIRDAVLAAVIALMAALPSDGALAQVVTQLPAVVNANTVLDLGNGPLELRFVQGSAFLFTAQGSGIGSTSGSSTSLTLTAVPTTAPCVGCIISGTGITSGTTVAAYNGVTSLTLSAAMTVAASTPLAWGATCPTSIGSVPAVPVQASVGNDVPLYTQARICAAGAQGAGAQVLPFPIGAH